MNLQKKTIDKLQIYINPDFDKSVKHFYTTKHGGVSKGHLSSLNLGFSLGDERENVLKNYEIVANALGSSIPKITATKQVHRDEVSVVGFDDIGRGISKEIIWESDALVTNLKDVVLGGFYADCVVCLFHDTAKDIIAVAHSGWRGTALNIIGKTIDTMKNEFSSDPSDIKTTIGPSIMACCFETHDDVPNGILEHDPSMSPFIAKSQTDGKFNVDLQGICQKQMENSGILPQNICKSEICTACNEEEFWSHRKTMGKRGVHGAFICLSEDK